ncbi:hypothetical protein KEM52_002502 [Ascosphaera acerosa]|nr:hypothetical protein KEM52_002502 [Ascosphaera acerosa]
MYFQSKGTTSMPIPFTPKAAATTSLSPEDSTSKLWSGHSTTFTTTSSWSTVDSGSPSSAVFTPPPMSTLDTKKPSYFAITPEESRPNISCAFPSWPCRTALYAESEMVSTPSAYISDEDLLWSCTPSEELGGLDSGNGSDGSGYFVSTAYQPVTAGPAAETGPTLANIASAGDEKEQARKFRAAQKNAMKLAQMAMVAAAEQRGKRRKGATGRVAVVDRRRRAVVRRS